MPKGLLNQTEQTKEIQQAQILEERQTEEEIYEGMRSVFEDAEAEVAREEARRRQQIRDMRTQQIRESCQIQVPTTTIRENSYGTSFKENIGAKKRAMRIKMRGSRLRQKDMDAKAMEEAKGKWDQIVKERQSKYLTSPPACEADDLWALSAYLTDNAEENQVLFPEQTEGRTLTQEQTKNCIRQFMDLPVRADLRTDTTLAKESAHLEELAAKTDAMKYLLRQHPEMTEHLTEDETEDLKFKINILEQVTDYYRMQKKVITHPYYRTHYNSEISHKYKEQDTPEQKNLSIMLWQAERLRTADYVAGNGEHYRWLYNYQEPMTAQEWQYAQQTKDLFLKHHSETEYGKTKGVIEDSRHADYFRAHNQEGDPIYDRMIGENYRIVGFDDYDMGDTFCRFLATLPRWKAIQHMSREQLEQMMQSLSQRPADPANQEEVQACKQANIQGLKLFKEQLVKQMQYLKNKYGNGMYLLSPQEVADHEAEFINDFTNMQTLGCFCEFIRKLPKEFGLYDEMNEADKELVRLESYYQGCSHAEGMSRNLFASDQTSYSQYKMGVANLGIALNHVGDQLIEVTNSMHLDVKWYTLFNDQDVEFDELTRFIKYKPMKEWKEEAGTERPSWNQLFPETKTMSRKDAAVYFLQKEFQVTEEKKRQWRREGLDFGAINYFGVGTDDFPVINGIYRQILESEELQREHGITSPEALDELREHVRQNGEMQVFDKTEMGYSLAAANMLDRLDAMRSMTGGDTGALFDQLTDDLNALMMEHHQRASEYRSGEGDRIFNDFSRFKEAQNLWLYPPHKEIMERVIEPEIQKQQPDATVTLSGLTLPTFKENYGSEEEAVIMRDLPTLLKDRRLKEGADPAAFQEILQQYNQEFAKERVFVRMRNAFSQDVLSPEKYEPLWNEIPRKRTLFQHDICGRHRICDERKEELYHQLEQMTEEVPKTAEQKE